MRPRWFRNGSAKQMGLEGGRKEQVETVTCPKMQRSIAQGRKVTALEMAEKPCGMKRQRKESLALRK